MKKKFKVGQIVKKKGMKNIAIVSDISHDSIKVRILQGNSYVYTTWRNLEDVIIIRRERKY